MKTKICITLLTLLSLIFLLSLKVGADIIPDFRKIDWSAAGVDGVIPTYVVGATVSSSYGDGSTDARQAFIDAIAACPEGQAVEIPEGTYRLSETVNITKGIVLRGQGIDKTEIVIAHDGRGFNFYASNTENLSTIVGGYTKGCTTITVSNPGNFSAEQYVHIRRENTNNSAGQMNYITGKDANDVLTLQTPLYCNYNTGSVIQTVNMLSGCGVEDMLIRTDWPTGNNYMANHKIHFQYCVDSWVKNIETDGYSGNCVLCYRSYRCEIRDSYFHTSLQEALSKTYFMNYSVQIQRQTSDCLVENNIFDYFRHAIVLNYGAVGNVFAYNFSFNVMSRDNDPNEVTIRRALPDLELHFDTIEFNLLESNEIETIQIDNNREHHFNTIFRNRTTRSGINVFISSYTNIICNEMPPRKYVGIYNTLNYNRIYPPNTMGVDPLIHANYITYNAGNEYVEDGSVTDPIPDSLYLSSKPSWFGDLAWPALGGDFMNSNGGTNQNRIPAEVRYWSIMQPENTPENMRLDKNSDTEIVLSWTTSSSNNPHFIICRSLDGTNFTRIATTSDTSYIDSGLSSSQTYWYYVRARNNVYIDDMYIDGNVTFVYSGLGGESDPSDTVDSANPSPPIEPEEDPQNQTTGEPEIKSYPNPYEYSAGNPMTFEFSGITGISTLKIYSIAGRLVKKIELAQGQTTIQWDGKDENGFVVASGLYLYVLTTNEGKIKKGKFAFVK